MTHPLDNTWFTKLNGRIYKVCGDLIQVLDEGADGHAVARDLDPTTPLYRVVKRHVEERQAEVEPYDRNPHNESPDYEPHAPSMGDWTRVLR